MPSEPGRVRPGPRPTAPPRPLRGKLRARAFPIPFPAVIPHPWRHAPPLGPLPAPCSAGLAAPGKTYGQMRAGGPRYATALYSAATKQKKLEQVEKELGRVWVRLLGAPRPEVTQGLGGRGLPAAVRTLLHAVRLARPACALRSTPRAPPRPGELLEGASAPKGASSLRAPPGAAVSLPVCSLLSSVLA